MNILFVSHSGKMSGGANRSLVSLMVGLREQYGVVPSVLIPEKNSALEALCRSLGIDVYFAKYHRCCTVYHREFRDVLRAAKIYVAPVLDYFLARKISRTLPADIDLIYTNERMIVIGGYLARLRGVTHIWHVRSYGRENKTVYPAGYNRIMKHYADRIILISKALYHSLSKYMPAAKMRLVYNGVRLEDYALQKKTHTGYRLLLTGRIVPQKGQDEAVCAFEILTHHWGVGDAELFFAGEIPDYEDRKYITKLKQQIHACGLEQHVHFLGEVTDMRALRACMDVELVCSWCEAFGRVTVEAMCAGLPVIGTDSGGTAELILDGQTGYLYPHGAPDVLAERIYFFYCHRETAQQMGACGLARAKQHFSMERTCACVYQVIQELLEEEAC